jgi:hypothetical protein
MVDTVEPGSINVLDSYDGEIKVGEPDGKWDGKNHLFDSCKTHCATKGYSGTAIDLIADSDSNTKPIRSDIERLCQMSDENFVDWYRAAYFPTLELYENYQSFASIPNLDYTSEDQKFDMTAIPEVEIHLENLRKGLEYVKQIKTLRAEYRGYEQEINSKIQVMLDEMEARNADK